MRFWTAIHEMGHSFNLAHSWQKSLGTRRPWVPLADEPEARSFMNYPFNVVGGQAAFFANFEYRFSDQELLFIRHAPERFVQMGNADWFDHHGFEEAAVPAEPTLQLELRVNRERARYEFMEPVWLELKLKNIGDQPRLVDADALDADSLTVILKKQGKEARQLIPFRQKCTQPVTKALMPGDAIYGTVLASAGLNGWDVAEPGTYTIQAAAHVGDEDVVSAPLDLKIAPPNSRDEEYVAGDLFDQGPARVLTLGGSGGGIPFLEGANDVLQEIVERFPERRISLHARVALGNPHTIDYKTVLPTDDLQDVEVVISKADPDEATDLIEPVLVDEAQTALETLGHIRYRTIAERTAKRLEAAGADAAAAKTLDSAIEALAARKVDGRPIKPEVIEDLKETRKELAPKSKAKPRAKAKKPSDYRGRLRPRVGAALTPLRRATARGLHGPRGTPRSRGARAATPRGARSRIRGTARVRREWSDGSGHTYPGERFASVSGYGSILLAPPVSRVGAGPPGPSRARAALRV